MADKKRPLDAAFFFVYYFTVRWGHGKGIVMEQKILVVGQCVYCEAYGHGVVKKIRTHYDNTMKAIVYFEAVDIPQVYCIDGKWAENTVTTDYDINVVEIPKSKFLRNAADYAMWGGGGFIVGYLCEALAYLAKTG